MYFVLTQMYFVLTQMYFVLHQMYLTTCILLVCVILDIVILRQNHKVIFISIHLYECAITYIGTRW